MVWDKELGVRVLGAKDLGVDVLGTHLAWSCPCKRGIAQLQGPVSAMAVF